LSLLSVDPDADSASVHTLVVQVACFIEKDADRAGTIHRATTDALLAGMAGLSPSDSRLMLLAAHGRAVIEFWANGGSQNLPASLLALMQRIAELDAHRGSYASALALQSTVQKALEQLPGADNHDLSLTLKARRAQTMRMAGDLQGARQIQEAILASYRLIRGGDDERTAFAIADLAATLGEQGHLVEARELLTDCLRRLHAIGRREDDDMLIPLRSNLAGIQLKLGEAEQAIETLEAICRLQTADSDDQLAESGASNMSSLASALHDAGRFSEAAELKRRVVTMREQRYEADHPLVISARVNLAVTLNLLLKHAEAFEILRPAISSARKVYLSDHPRRLWAEAAYGYCLMCLGRLDEAEVTQRHVLKQRTDLLGSTHIDVLKLKTSLAETLRQQGRQAEAAAILEQVFDVSYETLGTRHALTLSTFARLPELLSADKLAALIQSHPPSRDELERIKEPRRRPAAGRNEPCPCGSGRKFKRCCGR